ncbi:MAG: spore coat protein U domain-containing protein [Nitrosomonadales bacterium]|nr:spore coat protein U domain-containing protein [Nitrosomonadales bacterium]
MKSSKLKLAAILVALGMVPASAMAVTTATLNVNAVFTSATASISVAGPLDFGTRLIDGVGGDMLAYTTFDVTVTNGVNYTVTLDGGLNPSSTDTTVKNMTSAANSLWYILYRTGGPLGVPWDSAVPIPGTGTGSPQTFNADALGYRATLSTQAGTYSDTVTITVTY